MLFPFPDHGLNGQPYGLDDERHLGGYLVGGDPQSYCKDLWEWIIPLFGIESMIDVGCGQGYTVEYFEKVGCHAIGIDGSTSALETAVTRSIIQHDYTKGPIFLPQADLCWSCEFVQHVEEKYIGNFLMTFAQCRMVILTHAVPRQAGWHHVNCQMPDYWIGRMRSIGYDLDIKNTILGKIMSRKTWFGLTGMIFQRREAI